MRTRTARQTIRLDVALGQAARSGLAQKKSRREAGNV